MLQSEQYSRVIIEHPEINSLINEWQEKTKHYTYRDKIRLITIDYSQKLQGFDSKSIDNALNFLQRRQQSHGKNDEALNLITIKIKDGSVKNINQEAGINDRDSSSVER